MNPRPFVPTLWTWAEAILDNVWEFAFAGVDRPARSDRLDMKKDTFLSWHLTASEQYMDRHVNDCAASYMDSDYDDDWREECERALHDHTFCPNKDPEGFKVAVEERFADENKRREWGYGCVDPQWEWDCIREEATQIYFVYWLLKTHPITAIRLNEEWIDIDDVLGFCQTCGRPVTSHDINDGGNLRDCLGCSQEHVPLQSPDLPPLMWPRGASIPRNFDGTPMPPPPPGYEEYMNEASERRKRLRENAAHLDEEGAGVQQGQSSR